MKPWVIEILNAAPWAISGVIFLLIAWDFVKVERARRSAGRAADAAEDDDA